MKKRADRLSVDKEDLGDFRMLIEDRDSPFYKRENKDVFMMAMITGYKNGTHVALKAKEGFIREEYLNSEERSIIKSIAIQQEKNLSVLLDMEKVYQIAEEYAKGGVKYLKDSAFKKSGGSYIKRLESELLEEFERFRIGKAPYIAKDV
jgi:hypothetical protein